MLLTGFRHHFEMQGRGGNEGPNIAAAEHFSGVDIEQALARELIQNALDARAPGSKTVEVDFDLQMMDVDAIPDVVALREASSRAAEASAGLEGRSALDDAMKAFSKTSVPVLCIGDSGTTGLTGRESVDDPHSALSSLTRSVGASSNDGDRGGSFGIGSAVGVLGSRMRTVAYISRPIDMPETVFASTARFASFKDEAGEWRQSTGYLTAIEEKDLRYPRGIPAIGPFTPRTKPGTDVYVLDYRGADTDNGLLSVKRSAAENFWAAIHEGHLVVRGSSDGGNWVLTADSLESELEADEILATSTLPFYRARTRGSRIPATLRTVGDVELYVNLDDVPETMHFVQFMRKPLMKVQNYEQRGVQVAAVFICRDDKGNERLRKIEPPAHDRWNAKGPRSDSAAVDEIRLFVRQSIRDLIPKQLGDTAEIKGLARFLPTPLEGQPVGSGSGPDHGGGDPGGPEGLAELGVPQEVSARSWKVGQAMALPTPAVANPAGGAGSRGERKGTKSKGAPSGRRGKTAPAVPGDGRSRIRSKDITLRAFVPRDSSETVVVITALEPITGDLELIAIGSDDDFDLSISTAVDEASGVQSSLEVSGSTIRDLELGATAKTLRITFSTGRRYRLGVRDG